jgi:hypothetical protein
VRLRKRNILCGASINPTPLDSSYQPNEPYILTLCALELPSLTPHTLIEQVFSNTEMSLKDDLFYVPEEGSSQPALISRSSMVLKSERFSARLGLVQTHFPLESALRFRLISRWTRL